MKHNNRVSLCSPGCPGTHSVDQAGLELRNPPASASQVLGLKVYIHVYIKYIYVWVCVCMHVCVCVCMYVYISISIYMINLNACLFFLHQGNEYRPCPC